MNSFADSAPAVVVGLCAHGLALVRALHTGGVRVHALEANPKLAGMRTRCATIHLTPDINGEGLVDALQALAQKLAARPVLFLTNDRMVEVVGRHAEIVSQHYVLNWANAAERLLPLLRKNHIEERCDAVGMPYPRTVLLEDLEGAEERVRSLRFPVIAKPTRPVSAFKTIVSDSEAAFRATKERMRSSMPAIVQEFIPGDDTSIRFGALYLDHGRVVSHFEGRKLRSRPMGHTTIAVSEPSPEIHALAQKFFGGLDLSGPVSLELKQDREGRFFVIEPTVGRTDFWVGLCIANGVNFPLIEYLCGIGESVPTCRQDTAFMWINGERDPGAIGWLGLHHPATLLTKKIRGVYVDRADPEPFMLTARRRARKFPGHAYQALRRLVLAS